MFNTYNTTGASEGHPTSVTVGGIQSAFHVVNNPTQRGEHIKKLDIETPVLAFHLKQHKTELFSYLLDNHQPPVGLVPDKGSLPTVAMDIANCTIMSKRQDNETNFDPSSPSERSLSSSSTKCQICNDRATGKHYGASSCDGCKGFFRRTVRKNQTYACRFSDSCLIDKDKRNTCRFCRYEKCLKAGMKKQAVQSERDRISVRRKKSAAQSVILPAEAVQSLSSCLAETRSADMHLVSAEVNVTAEALYSHSNSCCASTEPRDQLEALKQAEHLFVDQQQQASAASNASVAAGPPSPPPPTVIAEGGQSSTSSGPSSYNHSAALRLATVGDLADAIKEQLLLLVDWAKALPPFIGLSLDDQVSLLRAYAAEHLLLGVARRSLGCKDLLLLSNDACIPRNHSSQIHDVNHVILRILDELVEPMRELQLDDTENGCLKALLFFNPNAFGLVNKQKVKQTRQSFLEAFHEYVTTKRSQHDKVRFGNLLLLLPPLQSMSQQFIEDLQLATLFGISTFDKLLEELLLATASSPFLTDGFSAVAKKMAGSHVIDLTDPTVDPHVQHSIQGDAVE